MPDIDRRQFLTVPPVPRVPVEGYWLHVSRTAMACRFEVTLPAGILRSDARVEAAQLALDEVERLEQQLSVFRDTSEVSEINRRARLESNGSREPVRVESSLFRLISQCLELYRETEGCFDITAGPLSKCWGFLKRQGRLPDRAEIETALSIVGSDRLILDSGSESLSFALTGAEINFGSIGKGYALDQARLLLEGKVQTALLSAGSSSMLAIGSGAPGERGWVLGIRDPRNKNRRLGTVRLQNCALATSGSEEQFFEANGRRYGHIIDPRSGFPADGVLGVTVIAQSAATADALATAFFIGGRELAERYCESHNDVLAILLENGCTCPILIGGNQNCEVDLAAE